VRRGRAEEDIVIEERERPGDAEIEARARALHADAVVMDMTCPLMNDPTYWGWWIDGGVTVAAPSVNLGDSIRDTTRFLARWLGHLRRNSDRLLHVLTIDDIHRAKREQKLGILFHFQNTLPFERDLDMLEVFHRLGVRVIQLAYNEKNHVGNGCEERSDDGLSNFGIRAIAEMNRLGIVVDCAHTGLRTTHDALDHSSRPVVVSHGNARAVCDNQRNLPDDLITRIAEQGGLVGLVGFAAFVRRDTPHPTLEDLVDHCDHICALVGSVDAVALGIDYYDGMVGVERDPEGALRAYRQRIESGVWNERNYPPPPHHYPKGLDDPSMFANFTVALKRRGYADDDVRKILGGNWLRVLAANGM
jgi:membrane dipeptidase